MSIPTYQEFLLPVLAFVQNGATHTARNLKDGLANQFGLTEDERQETIPSGKQTVLHSRIHWACYYLKRAGLLQAVKRGEYQITESGRMLLDKEPSALTNQDLMAYPEFAAWYRPHRSKDNAPGPPVDPSQEAPREGAQPDDQTPDQRLDEAFQAIRERVLSELLERVRQVSPQFFERLVVDLLLAMGYGGGQKGSEIGTVTPFSNDGGIDGVIREDPLGLDNIYIQAKRNAQENIVGAPEVQQFSGSLDMHGARKGVLITTSRFSGAARAYVDKVQKKIVLIDGERLALLMLAYGLGVQDERTLAIPKVDQDYFDMDGF